MGIYTYSAFTRKREDARANKSKEVDPPGLTVWIDTVAALIPVEVLAFHALALKAIPPSERGTLRWTFIGCFVACCLIYLAGHIFTGGVQERTNPGRVRDYIPGRVGNLIPNKKDLPLMFLPAGAFVAWTMLQKDTLFDAVWPTLPEGKRFLGGAVLAIVVGVAALANSWWQDTQKSYIGHDDPKPEKTS